jgi:hydroxypyruvate reductase
MFSGPDSESRRSLSKDALRIWKAGLEAIRSERLLKNSVRVEGNWLHVGDEEPIDLRRVGRIAVVGAGKAGAGMAAALEDVLGPQLSVEKHVSGWVNVPADCVRPLQQVNLHAARPARVNEPTAEGVAGGEEILRLVGWLGPTDLCFALISGGGSALLPAPVEGISLDDLLAVTRHLTAAGADIAKLNTVRKQLSRIAGGGLARACSAGRLIALIISDVPGDALSAIASGPTVEDRSTPEQALEVLKKFDPDRAAIPAAVYEHLTAADSTPHPGPLSRKRRGAKDNAFGVERCRVANVIIGNNATAVDAAGAEAERLGYSHAMVSATKPEGPVEEIGRHLADMAISMRDDTGPDCLVSGGEGTVRLAPEGQRGLGGRNQQLALAALVRLAEHDAHGIAIVSAGTDGEDGPTDAAGAIVDESLIAKARRLKLDPRDFLRRNDAYRFFEPLGGLLLTGPTHTNVCDLRVVTVRRRPSG